MDIKLNKHSREGFYEEGWALSRIFSLGSFVVARRVNHVEGSHSLIEDLGPSCTRVIVDGGSLVGTYHTHPPGATTFSLQDVDGMKTILGYLADKEKGLYCLIECEKKLKAWYVDHSGRWFVRHAFNFDDEIVVITKKR